MLNYRARMLLWYRKLLATDDPGRSGRATRTVAGAALPELSSGHLHGAPRLGAERVAPRFGAVRRRHAAHVARESLIERQPAMQGAAVVPHDQVADPPGVAICRAGARRMFDQFHQKQPPVRHLHADD